MTLRYMQLWRRCDYEVIQWLLQRSCVSLPYSGNNSFKFTGNTYFSPPEAWFTNKFSAGVVTGLIRLWHNSTLVVNFTTNQINTSSHVFNTSHQIQLTTVYFNHPCNTAATRSVELVRCHYVINKSLVRTWLRISLWTLFLIEVEFHLDPQYHTVLNNAPCNYVISITISCRTNSLIKIGHLTCDLGSDGSRIF